MPDIEIEIDGRTLTAKSDQMIIQVADEAGIYIPRFCYHKHLSIAANCRMCLVEVEKVPKALPACATPVTPGMKVFTRSIKTQEAQRAVMEFLLINHPLDCPICDQGGECELQDLSMGYGSDASEYNECKRATPDDNLGPLIASEMTRCIYCTRCVRFGAEVAGLRELGATYRGEHTEISTFVKQAITSEVSGNIIDLCPVGALTSKPYRFTARAWELDQAPSIAPHDCLGSNIFIHTRYGAVMRVVARENTAINMTWISDRDRFSYTGLLNSKRLTVPMIRSGGKWQHVEWQEAFEFAAAGLKAALAKSGANHIGALASPNSTLEEFYLLQKVMRALGSNNVDHRLREQDTSDQAAFSGFPGLMQRPNEIAAADAIVLLGTNVSKELPLIGSRVREAALKGAKVIVINPMDYKFNFSVSAKKIVAPHLLLNTLTEAVNGYDANANDNLFASLRDKKNVCIIVGALANHHPNAASIRYQAQQLATRCNGKLNIITDGCNAAGAWIAGAIPHRMEGGTIMAHPGLSAYQMLETPLAAYLLLNIEPDLDFANAALADIALKKADFVVALSLYENAALEKHADVILPIAAFTETAGTYVNAMGDWQSFKGVAKAFANARPAWKILRVLGNFLELPGFDYENCEAIKHDMQKMAENIPTNQMQFVAKENIHSHVSGLSRIGEIPIYAVDNVVRHATPLQETQILMEGPSDVLRIHPETAQRLQLQDNEIVSIHQGESVATLPLKIDPRVAVDAVWIAGGVIATCALGDLFGEVTMTKGSTS